MTDLVTAPTSRWYDSLGEWGRYSVEQVHDTYGVHLKPKWKPLRKFGRRSLPAADTKYTIMTGLSTADQHEVYSTGNFVDSVVCSTTGNTQAIHVEGHTIDTSGDLTFVIQQATLTGSTPVTLSTPLARCTRLYVKPGTFAAPTSVPTGAVYAYKSTVSGVSGGVPSTLSAVACHISSGNTQSQKAATSVSYKDYWCITDVSAALAKSNAPGGGGAIDFDLEFREAKGGVFRPIGLELSVGANSRSASARFEPYLVIPANSDVRMVGTPSTTNVEGTALIEGFLLLSASTADKS